MSEDSPNETSDRRMLISFYASEERAQQALQKLIDEDFPPDRVSLLGQAGASGDDPLGVYYPSKGDRVRGWGRMGAIWGGVLGILGGAAGMLVIPGIGAMMIVGPIAEILAGAVAGAGLGGGVMAGSAVLSEVAVTAHRMGVPESAIEDMQRRLRDRQYLLLLILHRDEVEHWDAVLQTTRAEVHYDYPFLAVGDMVAGLTK